MSFYEKKILPKVLDLLCGSSPINYQRKKIVPKVSGNVLEIGIGSGLNLPHYNVSNISNITALDPAEELTDIAKKRISELDLDIDVINCGAEEIPLESKSFDSILVTYTLCSIENLDDSMREIRRVMKDDGTLFFCEHGIAPDLKTKNWQNRINPIWKRLMGGCNINRDIPEIISNSKLEITDLETMFLPGTPRIAGFNYWGTARTN
tara:strand:+ start:1060 stop:1680 length:621 start_codon:yes stop_codon:yes gene_type:complete